MAFPLAAIGAGLGQFAQQYQQQQQQRQQAEMQRLRVQQFMQEQQDRKRQEDIARGSAAYLRGGGDTGGGDLGAGISSGVGSLPGATRMDPPQGMGGGWSGLAPGFARGADGGLTRNGRPPDTYLGGMLPGGGAAPAWEDGYTPTPSGAGFAPGLQRLISLGVRPEVARGAIDYMARNESGQNPNAVNPTSGATGRAQWLGPRKAALTSQFGARPNDEQQAQFMGSELEGPERRTLENLRTASTGKEGYDIWGRDYERPGGAALAKAGVGGGAQRSPLYQEAQAGARETLQTIDPVAHGRASLEAIMKRVDQTNPGADDIVKVGIVEHLQKLLAPAEKERWEMMKQQHHDQIQWERDKWLEKTRIEHEDRSDERQRRALEAAGDRGGTIVQQGDKTYRVKGDTMTPVTIAGTGEQAGPVTRPGAARTAGTLDPAQAKFWGQVVAQGGSLPPGLRRSGVVEQVMKEVPGTEGMTPGDFIARHAGMQADTGSLRNMQRMADAAISFEKLAEKNFDVALKLAPDAIPTELGPFFNRWVEEGETALGDPNVPPYVAAMITGANEYAKVMSGSTGTAASTVDARKEARSMFSPYMSLPQISQVIAVAKADMKNRENTLNEQVGTIKSRLGSSTPSTIAPPATPQKPAPPAAAGAQAGPAPGTVQDGYRFKGGNPADQANWEKVQ